MDSTVIEEYFLRHLIRYRSDSSRHCPHTGSDSHSRNCLSGHHAVMLLFINLSTIIVIFIEFWDFTWYRVVYISLQINTLLCYTLVSVLALGTGIARGQHYWISIAWYHSNLRWYDSINCKICKTYRWHRTGTS